jgi:hypothetical protein
MSSEGWVNLHVVNCTEVSLLAQPGSARRIGDGQPARVRVDPNVTWNAELSPHSTALYLISEADGTDAAGERRVPDVTLGTGNIASPMLSVEVIQEVKEPVALRLILKTSTAVNRGRFAIGVTDDATWPPQDHRMLSWFAGDETAEISLRNHDVLIVIVDLRLLFSEDIAPMLVEAIAGSNLGDAHRYSLWLNLHLLMGSRQIAAGGRGKEES